MRLSNLVLLFTLTAWSQPFSTDHRIGYLVDDAGPILKPDNLSAEQCEIEFHKGYFQMRFLNGVAIGMLPNEDTVYKNAQGQSAHDYFPSGFDPHQPITFWVYPTDTCCGGRTIAVSLFTPQQEALEMNISFVGDQLRQYEYRNFNLSPHPEPTRFYPQTQREAPLTNRRNPWGNTKSYLFVRCVFNAPTS